MERETIENAAKEYADQQGDFGVNWHHAVEDFAKGAQWRIDSVWHEVDIEKLEQFRPIFVEHHDGKFSLNMVAGRMKSYPMEWSRWAYVSDLLPDRKEYEQRYRKLRCTKPCATAAASCMGRCLKPHDYVRKLHCGGAGLLRTITSTAPTAWSTTKKRIVTNRKRKRMAMERKIGEIFEHDGEWYQCIKSTDDTCMNCDMNFDGKCPIPLKECEESGRSDKSYVIFKKLKPVGDPFACNYFGDKSPLVAQKYRLHHMPAILPDIPHVYSDDGNETTVAIEIKQDKKDEKDMEENKNNTGNCSECGDSRLEVIARAKEDLFKSTNIESNEEEMAVLDNILFRCYQMGWLDRYEEKEPNLKEFDLEAAKAGKPVCTRDGRKARIICFDKKDEDNIYPIVCLVQDGETESLGIFMKDGHSLVGEEETPSDLMMLPEKHEGWVNVYKASIGYESGKIYDSKEKAVQSANPNCIATVKIQWEE